MNPNGMPWNNAPNWRPILPQKMNSRIKEILDNGRSAESAALGPSSKAWELRYNHIEIAVALLARWRATKGARYPSGKGEVCKTFMRRFDSDPRLQPLTPS